MIQGFKTGLKTKQGKLVLAGILTGMAVILIGFSWYQANVSDITNADRKRTEKLERILFILEFSKVIQSYSMPSNDVLSHTANYIFGNNDFETDFIELERRNKLTIENELKEFHNRNSDFFQREIYSNIWNILLEVEGISSEIFRKMDRVKTLAGNDENLPEIRREYKESVVLMEEIDRKIDDIIGNTLTTRSKTLVEEYQVAHFEDMKSQESANNKVFVAVVVWETALVLLGFIGLVSAGRSEEQKKRLRESQERFKTIVRTASEGFWLFDKELKTVDVNSALCSILGYKREEIMQMRPSDLLGRETVSLLSNQIALDANNVGKSTEIVLRKKDGSEVFAIFNITALHDQEGTPAFVFAFITDITERKKAEAEVMSEKKDMELALSHAAEVLRFLSKTPQLVPFFEASPVFHSFRELGGGDIVRWITFRKRYAGLYLHDVSGHDIHALLMNILATGIVDYHKIDPSKKAVSVPSVFLKDMNAELLDFSKLNSRDTSMFLTAVYLLMDFETRNLKISLAGHTPPVIICPDGTMRRIGETGPLLGVFDVTLYADGGYKDVSFTLRKNELLFIHSDGLIDEEDEKGVPFKEKLYERILPGVAGKTPDEAYRIVKEAFLEHRGESMQEDDVSFVFLGVRPEDQYATHEFLPGPTLVEEAVESIVNIRQSRPLEVVKAYRESGDQENLGKFPVVDDLGEVYQPIIEVLGKDGWSCEATGKISLVLHEMLMNAIIHGNLGSDRHTVKIAWILHNGVLEVKVDDKGHGFDGSVLPQVINDETIFLGYGRGLHLLKEYADRIYFSDSGSTCWALFSKK